MSDTSKSGDPESAETSTPPPASFGSGRGSGLARGKRMSPAAASPTPPSAAPGVYKPSSIQIVTSESEYKNPFAPETPAAPAAAPSEAPPASSSVPPAEPPPPAPAPRPAAPSEAVSPVQATEPQRVEPPVTKPAPAPQTAVAQPEQPPVAEMFPLDPKPRAPEAKPELDILPPTQNKRTSQSWESSSFGQNESGSGNHRAEPRRGRRDERPVFKPNRREPRPENASRPEARPDAAPRAPRHSTPAPVRKEPAAAQKSGGIIGWLKGLFAAPAPADTPPARDSRPAGEPRHDDGNRRRRRGGRGRSGGFQGGPGGESRERGAQPGGENRGGENRGGGGRRRRRGGRGRGGNRSDGGEGGGQGPSV